jgi:hypothetical protein
MTDTAGFGIVYTIGPIRQIMRGRAILIPRDRSGQGPLISTVFLFKFS